MQVKLSHYYGAWQPPLILLVALMAGELARWRFAAGQGAIAGGLVATLLLVPFAYLGVDSVQAISQVQPGPRSAVAEHLEDTGHDKGLILVSGTGGVIQSYLPEAQVLNDPEDAQGEEIEAVVVDSNTSERKPNRSVESYLASNKDRFELTYTAVKKDKNEPSKSVGEIEVYTRKPDE